MVQASVPRYWEGRASGYSFLEGIAYNGTNYVAVSSLGNIIQSTDKVTWTEVVAPTGADLYYDVIWANNQFVAVGAGPNGVISTSTDGITWSKQTTQFPLFDVLRSITWTGNQYVAVGSAGSSISPLVVTSPDGVSWTRQTSPPTGTGTLWAVAASSSSQIVAVGDDGMFVSADGISWTSQTPQSFSDNLHSIVFGNGQYLAGGNSGKIYSSADGTGWVSRSSNTGRTIRDIAWNGTIYVAVGDVASAQSSADGISWTTEFISGSNLTAIAVDNGLFVTVDALGKVFSAKP